MNTGLISLGNHIYAQLDKEIGLILTTRDHPKELPTHVIYFDGQSLRAFIEFAKDLPIVTKATQTESQSKCS